MTHRHTETITFGTCPVRCAYTHKHTHTHTHAHTHFDIGTGTVGLPSFQALVGGGGVFVFVTHFSGGTRPQHTTTRHSIAWHTCNLKCGHVPNWFIFD